jgi:hypothetical protein
MKTENETPKAWSKSNLADFAHHAPIHPREPSPVTLTLTGTEHEIRSYLGGLGLARAVEDFDQDVRAKLKHGHTFSTADDALVWVRAELADRRMI